MARMSLTLRQESSGRVREDHERELASTHLSCFIIPVAQQRHQSGRHKVPRRRRPVFHWRLWRMLD